MNAFVAMLWDKLPSYIKWSIAAGVLLFYTPIKIREEMIWFIDQRVHAITMPIKEKQLGELKNIDLRLRHIEQDTRDIKNALIQRKP